MSRQIILKIVLIIGMFFIFDGLMAQYDHVEELWVSRHEGQIYKYGPYQTISVSPDGESVFVAGYRKDPITNENYLTMAFDTETGEQLWIVE